MQAAADETPGVMSSIFGLDDESGRRRLPAGRRRRLGRQLQRPRGPGDRRRPPECRHRGRPRHAEPGPARSPGRPWAAPFTPRSWPRPATGCARPCARPPSASRRCRWWPTSMPCPTAAPRHGRACCRLSSAARCAGARPSCRLAGLAGDDPAEHHDGERLFVELGPGDSLTSLIRRIAPTATALPVCTPADLDLLVEAIAGHTPLHAWAAVHHGEHLYVSERVVISPSAGVFEPPAESEAGPGSDDRRLAHRGRHPARARSAVTRCARRSRVG